MTGDGEAQHEAVTALATAAENARDPAWVDAYRTAARDAYRDWPPHPTTTALLAYALREATTHPGSVASPVQEGTP